MHRTLFAVLLVLISPTMLDAQAAPPTDAVRDLPLGADLARRFDGDYEVAPLGSPGSTLRFSFFVSDGALMGRIDGNDATRMLYQGGAIFRPEVAPAFVVEFAGGDERATRVSIDGPDGPMGGTRVAVPSPDDAPSLHAQLARMDSLLFDATYVACDVERIDALFTDDAEFYHDRNGFTSGPALREASRRLAADCPAARGIVRVLVPGSLEVYPIDDYGAVQIGEHRFVEEGVGSSIAKFVHLWRRVDDDWRLSRVLSFDHQPEAPLSP